MPRSQDAIRVEEDESGEEVIVFRHDWSGDRELGAVITITLVEHTDVPFEQIVGELQRSVNLAQLDGIFSPWLGDTPRDGGTLALDLPSFDITVHSDGWVEIEGPSSE